MTMYIFCQKFGPLAEIQRMKTPVSIKTISSKHITRILYPDRLINLSVHVRWLGLELLMLTEHYVIVLSQNNIAEAEWEFLRAHESNTLESLITLLAVESKTVLSPA